ncbi:MAG TPA: DUF4386 domain-containing protein [Thermoanaerobaculia bacterium]|nr:DUF4386 domain-containing protein [Thermoanaerobaculia bacterium]
MDSTKKAARVAGLLYLVACIPAPFSLIYVPRTLIVPGDATATASRILSHESMFRLGMAGEVITAIAFLFAVLALYRLLQGVNKRHAALMVTLFAISIPISCLNVLNEIAALILVRGADFLSVFTKPQLDAVAMIFLRLHGHGIGVAAIFWGLWLIPFGVLVYRSGFLPRILGVLLIINCFAYVIPSFTSLLLPRYRDVVSRITAPALLGEAAIVLWFLIRGARNQPLAVLSS